MNSAARLTGSSSACAALCVASYSSLRQRVMLRPCHLFSLLRDLPRAELVHEELRVGLRHGRRVHLHVGVELGVGVRVGDVDEKNTDAVTDFSSRSMPALAQACLTIAWVFWRGALIEVW